MQSITDNKRLDEWVNESRLDLRKIQYPRRDHGSTGTGLNTGGVNTPKKVLNSCSRPASPGLPPQVGTSTHDTSLLQEHATTTTTTSSHIKSNSIISATHHNSHTNVRMVPNKHCCNSIYKCCTDSIL